MKKFAFILSAVALSVPAFAFDINSDICDVNGTFNVTEGRRSADYYFNVEDSSNGNYACWSAAKWTGLSVDPVGAGEYIDLASASVSLSQSNSGFTYNGNFDIFVMPDSFNPGANAYYADWAGTYAGQSTLVGTYSFVETATGDVDSYDIVSAAIADSLEDGTLVLAFVENGSVAATWAGNTNFNYSGPTLDISGIVSPEPTSLILIAVAGLLIRRR